MADVQITVRGSSDSGPFTWWTNDQIRTWSERPWNESGRQLPQVHHAAVEVQVRFSDFGALSRWIPSVITLNGVTVSGIEWSLTDARRDELTEQSRVAAVHDARTKALSYANSLGLGDVRPVAIADLGMLGEPMMHGARPALRNFSLDSAGGGAEQVLDFTPQDVVITSYVDARFVA